MVKNCFLKTVGYLMDHTVLMQIFNLKDNRFKKEEDKVLCKIPLFNQKVRMP